MLIEYIGFIAAICTTLSFVPQAAKVLKTGNTEALSLMMYSIFTVGVALWLWYGILLEDLAITLANAVTLALAVCILIVKLRNDVFKSR